MTFCFPKADVQNGALLEGEFKCPAADGTIDQLMPGNVTGGLADVRQGAFGWKWVRAIHPVAKKQ